MAVMSAQLVVWILLCVDCCGTVACCCLLNVLGGCWLFVGCVLLTACYVLYLWLFVACSLLFCGFVYWFGGCFWVCLAVAVVLDCLGWVVYV